MLSLNSADIFIKSALKFVSAKCTLRTKPTEQVPSSVDPTRALVGFLTGMNLPGIELKYISPALYSPRSRTKVSSLAIGTLTPCDEVSLSAVTKKVVEI